jgi:hypothetical protein
LLLRGPQALRALVLHMHLHDTQGAQPSRERTADTEPSVLPPSA